MQQRQTTLFDEEGAGPRRLPIVGEQKDISYHGTRARQILNGPETTGMGFWSINPYVGCAFGCTYCYARYAHRYALERSAAAHPEDAALRGARDDMPPWLAFERRIFVKQNAAAALRDALRHGAERHAALAAGETLVIGTATDPYQPAERRYEVTRTLLEEFALHSGFDIGIVTKSDLIVRDIDVLRRVAKNNRLFVNVTVTTLDPQLARILEPRAPRPDLQLKALRALNVSGIDAGVICAPVLPGITDKPRELEQLVAETARHGGKYIFANPLFLKPCSASIFLPFLEKEFPQLVGEYRRRFEGKAFVSTAYRKRLSELMKKLRSKYGITYRFAERKQMGPQLVQAQQMGLFQEPEKRGPAAQAGMERRRKTMC